MYIVGKTEAVFLIANNSGSDAVSSTGSVVEVESCLKERDIKVFHGLIFCGKGPFFRGEHSLVHA